MQRPCAGPFLPMRRSDAWLFVRSSKIISEQFAKTSRVFMRERVPTLQNSKNPHAKWAAKPSTFGAPFFSSFGKVERARA